MKYLGIDVSKAKLDCALLDPLTDKRQNKTLPNDTKGFQLLADWLGKHDVALSHVHAVLEATGVYHEHAALCPRLTPTSLQPPETCWRGLPRCR